jgi:hypothetical protein
MTLGITSTITLGIMIIMTISIMNLSTRKLRILKFSIATLSIMTPTTQNTDQYKKTLSIIALRT